MIDVKLIKKPKNNGASSNSGIATNGNGYMTGTAVKEAVHAARADLAIYAERAGTANNALHAEEADHAQLAFDLDPDSPIRDKFLSRVTDDIAEGKITFAQGLVSIALAVFKDGVQGEGFMSDLYDGKSWGIDKLGDAEFESVRIRSALEVLELIINRLTARQGDELYTEGDTIETVTDNGDGTYTLQLKKQYDGYITAQYENNVCKGIVNTIAKDFGVSGAQTPTSGEYYTSWFRVNSVNTSANTVNVTLYPDDEVPSGKNYPPCELMTFARWGNAGPSTNPEFANRQSCFMVSSTDGRIVKLKGVTKPKLELWNYGLSIGKTLEFLRSDPELGNLLDPDRDYVFIDGLIARDILYYDKQGRPIPTYVDRGQWDATADYYCNATNSTTGVYETSEVWCFGCKYRCMKTGTHATPGWGTTDWAMIEGNPNFTIDFTEHELYWRGDSFAGTLTLIATIYNQDITSKVSAANIQWTRESYDAGGNRRVGSDNAWTPVTSADRKQILLTIADLDWDGMEGSISKVSFCCRVTIDDSTVAQAQMDYEF